MAEVWRDRREEALESAASVMAAVEQNENFPGGTGPLNPALVDKIVASVLEQYDPRNGGFGSQPKFPHSSALDLLIHVAIEHENTKAREAVITTLTRMSMGGMYDQLAGGFHRYSVDERWVVPHFEKMIYDNTELLRNYVHGYQSFGQSEFAHVAIEILRWLDTTMTDRQRGGFYGSQDADIDLDDDGDYFTWTRAEAAAVLTPPEMLVAGRYWDIGDLGDMHHNPQKNVLHVKYSVAVVAKDAGLTLEEAVELLSSARARLLTARGLRLTPFIDKTMYTGWNAMAVTAYLEAARVLRLDTVREFALKTLDRLLVQAWDGGQQLQHVIAYAESAAAATPRIAGKRDRQAGSLIEGNLDDYAFTVHACLDAWLATGKIAYYRSAAALADAMIARFLDRSEGAFLDIPAPGQQSRLGALTARRKPLQDSPTPGGNPAAASALLRLEALCGKREYREIAEDTLASFAAIVEHLGLYVGSYALALERLLLAPTQVVVVGRGAKASALEALATARFGVNKTVIRLSPRQLTLENLPEALGETLLSVPVPEGAEAWALVCHGRTCLPPITEPHALLEAIGAVV